MFVSGLPSSTQEVPGPTRVFWPAKPESSSMQGPGNVSDASEALWHWDTHDTPVSVGRPSGSYLVVPRGPSVLYPVVLRGPCGAGYQIRVGYTCALTAILFPSPRTQFYRKDIQQLIFIFS